MANKGVIVVGGIGIALGLAWLLSKEVEAAPCTEGETDCRGVDLYQCIGGEWMLVEEDSLECGYVPPVELASLYGIVTDADTGSPVGGIVVTLGNWSTTTSSSGQYSFNDVEPGTYSLMFTDPRGEYETLVV